MGDNQWSSGVVIAGSVRSEPWIINVEFSTNQAYHTSRKIGIQPPIRKWGSTARSSGGANGGVVVVLGCV
jgi:hypothetical protein